MAYVADMAGIEEPFPLGPMPEGFDPLRPTVFIGSPGSGKSMAAWFALADCDLTEADVEIIDPALDVPFVSSLSSGVRWTCRDPEKMAERLYQIQGELIFRWAGFRPDAKPLIVVIEDIGALARMAEHFRSREHEDGGHCYDVIGYVYGLLYAGEARGITVYVTARNVREVPRELRGLGVQVITTAYPDPPVLADEGYGLRPEQRIRRMNGAERKRPVLDSSPADVASEPESEAVSWWRKPLSEHRLRVGRLSVYIEWRDLWIGWYFAREATYFTFPPTLVFKLARKTNGKDAT